MRLALDIGGTFVKCASVTDAGAIVHSGAFPTDPQLGSEDLARHIVEGARKLADEWGGGFSVVGAGMAGFTDGAKGIVYESPNLPGVKNLELARALSEGLDLPAFVDNDATAAAWGEYLFGGREGVRDMLVVTLGTGVGGGLVLDGRLYRGARGMAGEIGQMPLVADGPLCPGGGRGCLEYYVGKAGLIADYKTRAGLTAPVEPKIMHERALQGDEHAIEAWTAYGHRLGVVLAGAASLLDLGTVVLTGGILGAWDQFSRSLQEAFRVHVITPLKDRVTVERTRLDGNAGIIGAAFLDRAR